MALLWLAGAAARGNVPAPAWPVECDWGPLASWLDDCDGNTRMRAVGPFWEEARGADGMRLRAAPRPFYARAYDPTAGRASWDCLWPVASGRAFGQERYWRALTTYFFDKDRTDPRSQYRFWILPLWFHGRDEKGAGYAALFPLGGEIRNILWKDSIRFFLWPLWVHSTVNNVQTTDVLWPIYSHTTTPDGHLEKLRVFPFYAHAKNVRQYDKHTVLWPFWTHARYTHPKASGTAWVLFPLCGRVNLDQQKGWMILPPFFQYIHGNEMTRLFCPWPFYQRETGYRPRLSIWPFYGWRRDGVLERRYWLWPIVTREKNTWGRKKLTRWSVAPFWNSVSQAETLLPSERKALEAAGKPRPPRRVTGNRTKLWPLFFRQYDRDTGTCRLRFLDLWPAVNPPPVERSWAPLWTLVDYRAHGPRRDLDVLWGLYRQTRREEGARAFSLFPLWQHERAGGDTARRWSVLKGLLAYDRTATNRQVRFLWLGRVRLAAPDGKGAETP